MNMRPNAPPNMLSAPAMPTAPQVARHVCFSGAIACSGVEPCDPCSQVLKELVFKRALAHAVTVEQAAIDAEMKLSAQQRRPVNLDYQQLANLMFANFFAALAQGFQQFHQQIDTEMTQPPENRSFTARDMAAIMQSATAYQALLREHAAATAAAANASSARNGQAPAPASAQVAMPTSAPFSPFAQPQASQPAHVVFDHLSPAPQPQPMAPPAAVNFDQAMQVADANAPAPAQVVQTVESTATHAPANGAGEVTKPSRRLTPEDFEMAAETHDATGGAPPGTSSSS